MIKRITIGCLLMISFLMEGFVQSEKKMERFEQVWTGYFNQTRISKRFGVWLDVQMRSKDDFFKELSYSIIRPGITYYLNDVTKLIAGYAYARHYPSDNHKHVTQPEHRSWQQLQWQTKYPRLRTMQAFRLEERFRRKILNDSTLADGNNFNFRARYNFLLQLPFTKQPIKKGDVSFILNDEIQVNLGKQILYNTFDQNRFFMGFAYHLNSHDNLQFGYMNVFQQLSSGNRYRSVHAARILYFHNLDLRSNSN